jgi:hypothetical protein
MTVNTADLDDRLAKVNDSYKDVKAPVAGELPPDGTYQAFVKDFDFFDSKAGELFMKTTLVVEEPAEYAGSEATTLHTLENLDRIGFTKSHLQTLGVENPDSLLGLPQRLAPVIGRRLEIRVKTSTSLDRDGNAYRNVYVNKRLDSVRQVNPATATTKPSATSAADDDIPF